MGDDSTATKSTVTELDAATGAVLGAIPVGTSPGAVSSDGTHVWVTHPFDGTVTELDAATGAVIGTFPVGTGPNAVSSDGTYVWVTNAGPRGTVTELDAATGAVLGTFPVGRGPDAVSSDGTHVWVANLRGDSVTELDVLSRQAISFTGPGTGTVGGQATLTATGGASGNPVIFTVDATSTAGACTVSGADGATVTYTGPGTCVIDANQAGGNGYAAAPQVQQSITVDQAPAFVTDNPPLAVAPGQAYGYTFAAIGTPVPAYALAAGAPAWLTISTATGQVSGTPPAGTTSFTYAVTATSTAGTATAWPYTVTVTRAAADADLSAALTCPTTLTARTAGTCTLTAANAGPATARRITAAILLPPRIAEVSCTGGCTRHRHAITWTLPALAPGASARLSVTIRAARAGRARLLGIAGARTPDPRPRNNTTIRTITITCHRRPRP